MIRELENMRSSVSKWHSENQINTIQLYPGMELTYLTIAREETSLQHAALDHILEIHYCHSGRITWNMGNGNSVCLGQSDFSLHTLKTCAGSVITLPSGAYEGLILRIDLKTLTDNPPELLTGTGITGQLLYNKFCKNGRITSLAGNEQTESIFSAFYNQPETLQLSYQRIKAIELLLYLSQLDNNTENQLTEYRSEQIETIREIHEYLIRHLDQRITIEDLSRQYLMNPTTLKAIFKSVYDTSVAAHIKEHRMKHAALLLRETNLSIAEIAESVSYDSQSRFASSFKKYYGQLPKDYRNSLRT